MARGELTVGVEAFAAAVVEAAVVISLDVGEQDMFTLDDDADADDKGVFAAIFFLSVSNMSKINLSNLLPLTPTRIAD